MNKSEKRLGGRKMESNTTGRGRGWKWVFGIALLVRVALIGYAEWQDRTMVVKYTDIDYEVFTDGARFVSEGQSPYLRSTYRYTPLLAAMLTPNVWLTKPFGKALFALGDIAIGYLIYSILSLPSFSSISSSSSSPPSRFSISAIGMKLLCRFFFPHHHCSSVSKQWKEEQREGEEEEVQKEAWRLFWTSTWLFNPFAIIVSTRGNAESLLGVMVLAVLYLLFTRRLAMAALIYGLAVHFKLYPIIYSVPLFFYCLSFDTSSRQKERNASMSSHSSSSSPPSSSSCSSSSSAAASSASSVLYCFLNRRTITLVGVSASTFLVVTFICYLLYGYTFLYETYLYHIVRKDHRHNFSVFFYQLYLSMNDNDNTSPPSTEQSYLFGLLSFVPQMVLLLSFAARYCLCWPKEKNNSTYRVEWRKDVDLVFCLCLQTITFVAFNKVCTVQYFIWYFCLLPLVLPFSRLRFLPTGLVVCIAWFAAKVLWLSKAFELEFLGRNTFYELWISGLLFFLSNMAILCALVIHHHPSSTPSSSSATRRREHHD